MLRLRRRGTPDEPLDLRSSPAFRAKLLDGGWEWRERAVQELEFDLGSHVRVTSSYQVALPSALVENFAPTIPHTVRALWPITTRPKQLLLDFDVIGPDGGAAHLVRRAVVAELQAEYLLGIATTEGAEDCVPVALLRAVCLQTPALIASVAAQQAPDARSLSEFLGSGLGLVVSHRQVERWLARLAPLQELLRDRSHEPPDHYSAAENVLLAMPHVDPIPATVMAIDAAVRTYCDGVQEAAAQGADTFLGVLAEYGRRWELFIETVLPVEWPATVRLVETRRLELSRRGETSQTIALREGASDHVEARLRDAAVVFAGFAVLDADARGTVGVGAGLLEGTRDTPESLSLYSSDPGRPYVVTVRLRLRPVGHVRRAVDLVVILVVAALVLALAVPEDDDLLATLSLLTVPTTFAATLLLTREQTALAAILLRGRRALLGSAAAILWLAALLRLSCALATPPPWVGVTCGFVGTLWR